MASITIITGCPGTGKTTLTKQLAEYHPQGVHLTGDSFYTFLAHKILPILPEAHTQNMTVTVAIAQATAAFVSGAYDVFVDGIIGPWLLPLFVKSLGTITTSVQYIVLRANLDDTVRRATLRSGSDDEAVVRHMHAHFANLGQFEHHAVDCTNWTAEETFNQILPQWQRQAFRLDSCSIDRKI